MKSSLVLGSCSLLFVSSAMASVTPRDSSSCNTKIDVHAHYVPDFYAQALRDAGHVPGPDGMPSIPTWTPETTLQFMTNNSIEKSYLSISSPGVYLTVPSKNATKNAIALARKVNENGAAAAAAYPDKLGYFVSLPLPDVDAAIAELDYAFTHLSPKPDGIVVMSNYYGMYLGDPALDPLYEAIDALDTVVFEHPTTPCSQAIGAQYSIDGDAAPVPQKEWAALNRPVATRQFAAPTLDFPFESARSLSDLFYSQVPSRFTSIRWIFPHAGGAITTAIDRVITYSTLYPDLNLTTAVMKATLDRSFYFDLAGPWPVNSSIPALLRWVDYTHIMWGSDTPFTPWTGGAALSTAFNTAIKSAFGTTRSPEKEYAVRLGNAKDVFGA